jgi:hypothetical protein
MTGLEAKGGGAPQTVHVVATCTDRKTRGPHPGARARDLPVGPLAARFAAWREALATTAQDCIPAERLYAGDHWQVVRGLPSDAPASVTVRVWVCSAGYGLIALDTPVRPYAATFSTGHPDTVAPRGGEFLATDWWNALSEWRPAGTTVRSLTELAAQAQSGSESILAALSEPYVAAVQRDLAAAADLLNDRLLILSVGARADRLRRGSGEAARLAPHLLATTGALKEVVGGAMQSLNARLARQAVRVADEWAGDPGCLRALFEEWSHQAPPRMPFDRTRSDDVALREYVNAALREDPSLTYTSLLRTLRASGRACEQARFRALFREVRHELALPAKPRLPRQRPA